MRAIVLVEWGPKRWKKVLIAPGEQVRIGRHERAELCLPHDDELSGLHCELAWDGSRCTVVDLKSAKGTILNGEPVESGEIRHGDWLHVGKTVLSVYFEGVVSPFTPSRSRSIDSEEQVKRALVALRAQPGPLFALVDAACNERISMLLRCCPEQVKSLYEGPDGEELEESAPYLVELAPDSLLLERLVVEGWGKAWSTYLSCRRPFREVRQHFRRNLLVRLSKTGERLYSRFYDPRVMLALLRRGEARHKRAILGEIERFLLEDEGGEVAIIERTAP